MNLLKKKAFSMGYEYALEEQREFSNKENKRKRREWEIKNGVRRNHPIGGVDEDLLTRSKNRIAAAYGIKKLPDRRKKKKEKRK